MELSIIVPVHNSQDTLRQCLTALYNSTFKGFEVIVVDDKSEDKSVEIAKKFKCKIMSLSENKGPSVARNVGVRNASGEIIIFLDSDMVVHDNAIEKIAQKFKEIPDIACVSGIYSKKPLFKVGLVGEYRALQTHYWKKSTIGHTTRFTVSLGAIKKKIFDEIGGFNEEYKKADVEDYEMGHRLTEKGFKLIQDATIQADHKDISSLPKLLKTVFRRNRMWMPLFFKRKKLDRGYVTAGRSFGLLFSIVSLFFLLSASVTPRVIYVSVIFFALFLLSDAGFVIFLLKEKGVLYFIPLLLIHYLTSLSRAFGSIAGALDYLTRK